MKYTHAAFLFFIIPFMGAGCLSSKQTTEQQIAAIDCQLSIDISSNPQNKTEYTKATFTYPCAWENQSSATEMKLKIPDTNMTLAYPTIGGGDLPMNGIDVAVMIMGQEHTRYIARVIDDPMAGDITYEVIRGPLLDELGDRPFYQYPSGNPVGNQMAGVFASLKLE